MKKRLKTLIKLAVWASIALYLVNKFVESSATIKHLLRTDHGDFYEWKQGKIFYTVHGCGTPILLLHDLHPSSSQKEWESVIDSLSSDHTVYAIDMLGCGRSEKPSMTYVNYLYVQLVHDFLEDVVGEKANIMATGKSASVAVVTAKMHPELVENITLVSPEHFSTQIVMPDLRSKAIKVLLSCPLLGVSLYYMLTSKNQLEYDFCERYFYNPFHVNSKTVQTYYESAHTHLGSGRHLMASIDGNYMNFDIRFAFANLKNQIHLIFGEESPYAHETAMFYKKMNPSVRCTFIEKTKMLPQLEAPEKFISAL